MTKQFEDIKNKNKNDKNIEKIEFTRGDILVYLSDGKVINTPISRFKKLNEASRDQLNNYEIEPEDRGWSVISWPEIDETIDMKNLDFPNE
jgi:hypothetical protein